MASETSYQLPVSVVTRDELRTYFRPRFILGEAATLSERRQTFLDRLTTLKEAIQVVS
jgi:hypothetical protein